MAGVLGQEDRRAVGQDRIMTNRMVTIVSGHGGGVMMADTVNLGPGGMFLATEEEFDVGDRFICRIDLGEPYKPVLSGAEVRWVDIETDQRGVGVQFLDIAEAAETLSGELPTAGPEKVRVRLPSAGSAIEAEVVERDGGSLVLELQLPFLEPGTNLEVGPDVAARSATVKSASWLGDEPPPLRLKLELNLEPSSAESAAEKVAAEDAKQAKPAKKPRIWQRPAKIHKKRKIAKKASPSLGDAMAKAAETSRKKKRWSRKSRATSRENEVSPEAFVDAPADVRRETKVREERTQEKSADVEKKVTPFIEQEQKKARTSTEEEVEEEIRETVEIEEEEEAEDTAEARSSREDPKEDEEQHEEAGEEVDDEFEPGAFNPFRAPLERILGVAMVSRLFQGLARLKSWIGERINGPKLLAAAKWIGERLVGGWHWTAERAGPLLSRGWKVVRRIKLWRRPRKQARGEPSTVVQHLTDRAKRVAAKRGRTIALILVLSLGAAGLATAGFGLTSSASAEDERENIQQEADQAGWTAGAWEEPEPVDSSDS